MDTVTDPPPPCIPTLTHSGKRILEPKSKKEKEKERKKKGVGVFSYIHGIYSLRMEYNLVNFFSNSGSGEIGFYEWKKKFFQSRFYLDIGRKDSICRWTRRTGSLSRAVIRGNSSYTVITVLTIMVARAVNINDRSDRADADGDNSCIVTFIRMSCFVGVPIK